MVDEDKDRQPTIQELEDALKMSESKSPGSAINGTNPYNMFATRADLARVEGDISTLKEGQENLGRNQETLNRNFQEFASDVRTAISTLGEKAASAGMIRPLTAVAIASVFWAVLGVGFGWAMVQQTDVALAKNNADWTHKVEVVRNDLRTQQIGDVNVEIDKLHERNHDHLSWQAEHEKATAGRDAKLDELNTDFNRLEVKVDGVTATRFTNERGIILEKAVAGLEAQFLMFNQDWATIKDLVLNHQIQTHNVRGESEKANTTTGH